MAKQVVLLNKDYGGDEDREGEKKNSESILNVKAAGKLQQAGKERSAESVPTI